MEIKDYLHLYIGQQFVMKIDNTMSPDHGKYTSPMIFDANALCAANSKKDRINPILILRKLSDMTEEEMEELIQFEKLKSTYDRVTYEFNQYKSGIDIMYEYDAGEYGIKKDKWTLMFFATNAHDHAWMFRKGFDLFGLIPAGLAIDKTSLKNDKGN